MTSKCKEMISIQAIQRNSSKVFIKIKSHKMKLLQLDLTFQHRDMKLLLTYQFVLTWEMQYDDDDVNFLFVFILNNFSISNISKGMSLENLYTFAFDFLRVKMIFFSQKIWGNIYGRVKWLFITIVIIISAISWFWKQT